MTTSLRDLAAKLDKVVASMKRDDEAVVWWIADVSEVSRALTAPASPPALEGMDAVAWATHHEPPMLFPTRAEAAAYCYDGEQPIPLYASPVAVQPDSEHVETLLQLQAAIFLPVDKELTEAEAAQIRALSAAIAAMQRPVAAQQAVTDGWIAVSERLPVRGQGWVIGVRNTIGGPRVGAVIYEDRVIGQMEWLRLRCPENGKPYEFAGCDVTHWQPMPTPPAQPPEAAKEGRNGTL